MSMFQILLKLQVQIQGFGSARLAEVSLDYCYCASMNAGRQRLLILFRLAILKAGVLDIA